MKNYVVLAWTSIGIMAVAFVLSVLAMSAITVAVGLLVRETYTELAAIADVTVQGAIDLVEWWEFIKYGGAF